MSNKYMFFIFFLYSLNTPTIACIIGSIITETSTMTHSHSHPLFAVTVDMALFGFAQDMLHVLLVQRKYPPYAGAWALPGGFVEPHEDLAAAALRELHEESGIVPTWTQQLHTFGAPGRDPRRRTISVAHIGICTGTPAVVTSDETPQVRWHPVWHPVALAFDHRHILDTAMVALQQHCHDLARILDFLPAPFHLHSVHRLCEQILHTTLDQAQFVNALHRYLVQHHCTPNPQTGLYERPPSLVVPFAWESLPKESQ